MPKIQLVLTDFDGTVVEFSKHEVSDKVRQTVIALEEASIRIVPVTGRYYEMARPVLELLGFEDLGIFDNGASIRNCRTGELVWSHWFEPGLLQKVASLLAPAAKRIEYTPDHEEHTPADNELERIRLIDQASSHVFALVATNKLDAIKSRLDAMSEITYYTAPSTDGDPDYTSLQVNLAEADKFHGVEALRKIVGVPKEHTLAIGDGDNDLPLFENAAVKVAMGNATAGLKAKADYVVGPVSKDGFVEAMQRYVL